MIKLLNKKGASVIELLAVTAIISISLTTLLSFLYMYTVQSYELTVKNNSINIAETTMNFFTKQSPINSISLIDDSTNNIYSGNELYLINDSATCNTYLNTMYGSTFSDTICVELLQPTVNNYTYGDGDISIIIIKNNSNIEDNIDFIFTELGLDSILINEVNFVINPDNEIKVVVVLDYSLKSEKHVVLDGVMSNE